MHTYTVVRVTLFIHGKHDIWRAFSREALTLRRLSWSFDQTDSITLTLTTNPVAIHTRTQNHRGAVSTPTQSSFGCHWKRYSNLFIISDKRQNDWELAGFQTITEHSSFVLFCFFHLQIKRAAQCPSFVPWEAVEAEINWSHLRVLQTIPPLGNWAKQSHCSLGTDVKIRFFTANMNVRLWMHQTDVRTAPSLNLPPPVTKSLLEPFSHLSSATLFFSSIYRLLWLLHFNTHSLPPPPFPLGKEVLQCLWCVQAHGDEPMVQCHMHKHSHTTASLGE